MYICVYSYFLLSSFAQEVERLEYLFLRGRLVDTYVAYVAQEGEVDMVGRILLVVLHEGEQCFVVVARDGQLRIMALMYCTVWRNTSVGKPTLAALRYNSHTKP